MPEASGAASAYVSIRQHTLAYASMPEASGAASASMPEESGAASASMPEASAYHISNIYYD
jgi:hypothetical protein